MDFLQLGIGRWVHLMAGILWVGLLYYFNFVQADAMKAAQADGTAAGITKHVAPRALFFFRWAAVVTWLAGAMILGPKLDDAFLFKDKAYIPIGVGAWLGTIMFFNDPETKTPRDTYPYFHPTAFYNRHPESF